MAMCVYKRIRKCEEVGPYYINTVTGNEADTSSNKYLRFPSIYREPSSPASRDSLLPNIEPFLVVSCMVGKLWKKGSLYRILVMDL